MPAPEPMKGTIMKSFQDLTSDIDTDRATTGWVPEMPEGILAVTAWLNDIQELSAPFGF